ncbi:MAG: lytic transglycosylase domain-containing protein [Acidobacteriia bacterium]|nr:lytic transglycosylase domain-containing protein [Terriglobia bacterium]
MRWLLLWFAWSGLVQNNEAQNNEAMRAALEQQRAAAATQREAVRKQAELAGPGPLQHTLAPAPAGPTCEPIADAVVTPLIEAAAKAHEVQTNLLHAVIQRESGFRPCAVSEHDAKGLMQLMPAALEQFKVEDPFDPKQNIEAGATYLKQLVDKYKGDLARVLGAYRIGPSVVDQAKGVPDIPEVRSYVDAILKELATPPALPQTPKPTPIGN